MRQLRVQLSQSSGCVSTNCSERRSLGTYGCERCPWRVRFLGCGIMHWVCALAHLFVLVRVMLSILATPTYFRHGRPSSWRTHFTLRMRHFSHAASAPVCRLAVDELILVSILLDDLDGEDAAGFWS